MTQVHIGKTLTGRKVELYIKRPGEDGAGPYVEYRIEAPEATPNHPAGFVLPQDEAVAQALAILEAYAPEKLAPPPYVPLRDRVGQYVRGTKLSLHSDGRVGRIIGPGSPTSPEDSARIEFADGTRFSIYNVPGEIFWEAVEVEVKSIPAHEEWTVVDA